MKPIAVKKLGIDEETGLEQQIVINQFTVDTEVERIIIIYRFELLSPKGKVVKRSDPMSYERYNRPEILYKEGEQIDEKTVAKGGEVKNEGNMKFDKLRESEVGKMLSALINGDIELVKSVETANEDLKQD